MIAYLRKIMHSNDFLYENYWHAKSKVRNLFALRFFFYDLKLTWRYMFWGVTPLGRAEMQARLLFYYHKLEKGLCMPGKKRMFGVEVVNQLFRLIRMWERLGYDKNDKVYVGAVDALLSYLNFINSTKLDSTNKIGDELALFLCERQVNVESIPMTPIEYRGKDLDVALTSKVLEDVFVARRSLRDFSSTRVVDVDLIRWSIKLAQFSPSACNRQPCKVYEINTEERKKAILKYQNGNLGFGHLAPVVLIVTANMSSFFDATERFQPYVDGGLFSMSLILALQSKGLGSCCLNWCVEPSVDLKAHEEMGIPAEERIVMLIAVGYSNESAIVPISYRKQLNDVHAKDSACLS